MKDPCKDRCQMKDLPVVIASSRSCDIPQGEDQVLFMVFGLDLDANKSLALLLLVLSMLESSKKRNNEQVASPGILM